MSQSDPLSSPENNMEGNHTVDGWNHVENPVNNGTFTLSTGVGFQPSTVVNHRTNGFLGPHSEILPKLNSHSNCLRWSNLNPIMAIKESPWLLCIAGPNRILTLKTGWLSHWWQAVYCIILERYTRLPPEKNVSWLLVSRFAPPPQVPFPTRQERQIVIHKVHHADGTCWFSGRK